MGFQINGTEVLGPNGIQNAVSPSFKTLVGQSITGTGNIQDDGDDLLLFNKVGTYTIGGLLLTTSLSQSASAVSASSIVSMKWANSSGTIYAVMNSRYYFTSGYASNAYTGGLAGTWKSKNTNIGDVAANLNACFCGLFQRIS